MKHAVAGIVIAGWTSLFAAGAAVAEVRVGVVLSLSGPGQATGIPDKKGLMLAQKMVNARGGIHGEPMQLIFEDDESRPDLAVRKALGLISDKQVKLLIGANLLANTVAIGAETDRLGFPQISITGINPAAEAARKCVLHTLPSQELNARALLSYARGALGVKRVAILHDTGYGQVVTTFLQAQAAEFGIELVAVEKFDIGATDVLKETLRVKAANPQAVIVVGLSPVPFRAVKQAELYVPVLAANASATYDTVKAMGFAADNIRFAEFVVGEDPLPHQEDFLAAFSKEYGHLPKTFETAAWDAGQLAAKALSQAGPGAGSARICEALRKPHAGALANYDFSAPDQTGLTLRSIVYSKLTNGRFSRLPYRNK